MRKNAAFDCPYSLKGTSKSFLGLRGGGVTGEMSLTLGLRSQGKICNLFRFKKTSIVLYGLMSMQIYLMILIPCNFVALLWKAA